MAVALQEPLTWFLPPQYLVSIPLRMFRLWAFTGMMAQVSPPCGHLAPSHLPLPCTGTPSPVVN